MPMLPLPGRSTRRYGRVGIIMGVMVAALFALYVVVPYEFAGTQLWSAQEIFGATTLTVRVYQGEAGEQGLPGGFPLLIFWRVGSKPICHKKAVTVQSDGHLLSYSLSGRLLRVSGGDPRDRMWAMTIPLDAH
jgi:hypothetical protein